MRGSLQANTSVALREAAVGGMGIAGAAAFIVRDALHSGQLVEVGWAWDAPQVDEDPF